MKTNALYAALSGAFLLGAATLAPAQNMTTTTTDKSTSPQSSAVHSGRDKVDKVTTGSKEGISRDEYKREKDRIEADAKAAKEKCNSLKDNAKDICQAEAKATEKVAKKELDYKNKPTEKNRYEAEKMKAEAAYEVAKEKCEDQKGAEMAACKKNAKADKDRAIAALKGHRKTVASADGNAARSGSTAGNTGGSATSATPSGSTSGTTPPSTTTGTKK
ncbi:MAG TPA: hypothetical protein VFK48_00425 [Usitatibacter sp.]|nr:hypothetical protein [Usitatibacter sp.]